MWQEWFDEFYNEEDPDIGLELKNEVKDKLIKIKKDKDNHDQNRREIS